MSAITWVKKSYFSLFFLYIPAFKKIINSKDVYLIIRKNIHLKKLRLDLILPMREWHLREVE